MIGINVIIYNKDNKLISKKFKQIKKYSTIEILLKIKWMENKQKKINNIYKKF